MPTKPDDAGFSMFQVDGVLKSHPKFTNRNMLVIDRCMSGIKQKDFLLFIDIYKGELDPFWGIELHNGMLDYVTGIQSIVGLNEPQRLGFYFKHLEHENTEVSTDAHREFNRAQYKSIKAMAPRLSPDTLAKWLTTQKQPSFHRGLYALLLAHCGAAKHISLFKNLEKDPVFAKHDAVDDKFLCGRLLLTNRWRGKKPALALLRKRLSNKGTEFLRRFAAVRACEFFHDKRPDVFTTKELADSMALLLDHVDMADLAVDDFRKWKRWEMDKRVLGLYGKKSHDIRIIKRSIVRFALQCPSENCKQFIRDEMGKSKRNRQWVEEIRMLLELEVEPTKTKE